MKTLKKYHLECQNIWSNDAPSYRSSDPDALTIKLPARQIKIA